MDDVHVIVSVPLPKKAPKVKPERLPWPRFAADDPSVPLGVDVVEKTPDINKLVYKFFSVPDVPMEELIQEVFVAIIHKNHTRSAHDPRKSSFGHYVYMVANNVCINLVHKRKRYDRERDSIDEPAGEDGRPLIETYEAEAREVDITPQSVDEFEDRLRRDGHWDLARFVRATRTGANAGVIREALSWGGRQLSNKSMRELRHKIQMLASAA